MPGEKSESTAPPAEPTPHYHGHRQRLRQRFLAAGGDAVSDYEVLELILFRAIPQRDVKPLAKTYRQIRLVRGGDIGTSRAAQGGEGSGRGRDRRAQDRTRGGDTARARLREAAAGAVLMVERARLLPLRHGVRRQGAVARALPRQAQRAHRRRGAANRHRRSHAGLSARAGQARARAVPVGNSYSYILMVQPTQYWYGQGPTDGLGGAGDRRVLLQ